MEKETDVVVLGAGIAGLTAGIYLKRSSLDAVVLDKGAPGGKLNAIHRIDNYTGVSQVPGPELAQQIVSQATELGVKLDYGNVRDVRKREDGKFLVTSDMDSYLAKAVIIATGLSNSSFSIPGEREHLGRGVSYCATCDGAFFKGKPVAVLGYQDHAVEDAIYLSGVASKVYFLAPKPVEATEAHWNTLKNAPTVEILEGANVLLVHGDKFVDSVEISQGEAKKSLDVKGIFPLAGEVPASGFLASLGLETNKGFILADSEMKTSVPGVFAAGDIVNKKLRQLITAASDGANAATSAISYVRSLGK